MAKKAFTKNTLSKICNILDIEIKDIQSSKIINNNGKDYFWFCLKGFYNEDNKILTMNCLMDNEYHMRVTLNKRRIKDGKTYYNVHKNIKTLDEAKTIINSLNPYEDNLIDVSSMM